MELKGSLVQRLLWILLQQGIGDTIRVSLTPEPGLPRSREVDVCTNLLQTSFVCQQSLVVQGVAERIQIILFIGTRC